jgi:hypothetical protein
MLMAALYVQRASRAGVVEQRDVRVASRIFWLGTCLSVLLVSILLVLVLAEDKPYLDTVGFFMSFLFWLVIAVAAAKTGEKVHRCARPTIVMAFALVPGCLVWLPLALPFGAQRETIFMLPVSVMKFFVCMLPAHCWHRFVLSASTRRAWRRSSFPMGGSGGLNCTGMKLTGLAAKI